MALTKVESGLLANTTVTQGTYGGADAIPVIVVDAQGRLTSVTNTSIVQAESYPHPFAFTSIGS